MTDMTETTQPIDATPPRRLVRRRRGGYAAGVCAGLGDYFDVPAAVYRVAFVALALAGGTGLLLYLAAWLVIPAEDADDSIAVQALRDHRERPWLTLGIGLIALAGLLALSDAHVWPRSGGGWFLAALAGGALVWWQTRAGRRGVRADASDEPGAAAPARRPSLFLPVLGALVAVLGLLGVLSALGVDVDWRVTLGAAAAVAGVAVVAGALTGRRVAGVVLLGLLLLAAFGVSLLVRVPVSAGVGDRVVRPTSAVSLQERYRLGVGQLTVDLSALPLGPGTTHVNAGVGVGELRVIVPAGVGVDVRGRATAGNVDVLGRHDDGPQASAHVVEPGSGATLVIDARTSVGDVEVTRE